MPARLAGRVRNEVLRRPSRTGGRALYKWHPPKDLRLRTAMHANAECRWLTPNRGRGGFPERGTDEGARARLTRIPPERGREAGVAETRTEEEIPMHHRFCILAVLSAALAIGTTGCSKATAQSEQPADRAVGPAKAAVSIPEAPSYRLSAKAQKVAALIDQGSHDAAHQLLRAYMNDDPSDAGLCCQYVRHIVLSCNPAYPGFIQTPFTSDGGYYLASPVARNAIKVAVQLDPKCAPYLVDTVLRSLEVAARQQLMAGSGCVGQPQLLHDPTTERVWIASGIEMTMINVGFDAAMICPAVASRWVKAYEGLTEDYAKAGKVATAMMMGNLTGELAQVGGDGSMKGPEDFKRANAAFLEALNYDHSTDVREWAECAANAYPDCFREELQAIQQGSNPDANFAVLQKRLREMDVLIPQIREQAMPTGGASPRQP